jgi:hypothetical protein
MSRSLCVAKCVGTCLLLSLFICFLRGEPAQGQAQTATITGTATDSSGGALAGAKVQVTNVATSISQSADTDSAGRYTVAALPVGTYDVQASLAGFQTVVHKGVTLSIQSTVVVDFSLPVGQVTQTVNVEAQVSRVQTENGDISQLVSPEQMRDLPLNGRNFEQLITLAPGVATIAPAFNVVTGRLYGMMNNYSISGARPTGQMFVLDGTDIRDFWEHATGSGYAGTSLGVEGIGEFQVLTNSYTSQFAGNGAVINATSRSGTNDLHGGAYEYFRNSVLDATDYPDQIAGLTSAPPFRRNQFGGALGGPIKKDKVFWFANYEGLRQGQEQTTPIFLPEPYVAQGMLPCTDITPTPAVCVPSTPANSTQPGVLIGAVPPVPGKTPLAEQIASVYSLCKGCKQVVSSLGPIGADGGGYYAAASFPNLIINEDYALGRIDYVIGSNDSLFGRYVFDDARVGDNPRDPLQIFPETDFTRNQFLTIGEKHIFSPTVVNSLRFGYVRSNENSRVQCCLTSSQIAQASANLVSLGGAPFTTDPLDFMRTNGVMEPSREDGQESPFGGIQVIGPDQNRPDAIIQSKFSGGDDVVWTHGAHTIKIGGVITRELTDNIQTAYANGNYFLVTLSLQDYLQGIPLITFAVPAGQNNSTRFFKETLVAPYVEDTWKVTPRLTLTLGLRYDYDTNPVGWAAPTNPGQPIQPITTLVGSYIPPTGPVTPGPGLPVFTPVNHVFSNNINASNWGPRFGFAFAPFSDQKTVIRGGAGVFFDPTAPRLYESGFIATPPAGFAELFFSGWPNPFSGGFPSPPSEFAGVDYQASRGSPYQIQYNLNVQREIWPGTVFSIGYVGSASRHLWSQMDINPPMCTTYPDCLALPQIPTSRPTASNATYFFTDTACNNPAQDAAAGGNGCYGSGVKFVCTPGGPPTFYPCNTPGPRINAGFGEMVQAQNTGQSSYNSLQVSLNRQFAHNLTGNINYTWSHCIDDASFASSLEEWGQLVTNGYNQRGYDWENCNFDIRSNFSANGLYALPFKGNRLVEGWQFGAILGIHSGIPLNIYNSGDIFPDPPQLGTEWNSRANYSFAPGCHPNHIIDKKTPAFVQWFDPSCYEAQAPGYLGNIKRNSVPGPGTVGADVSVTKNTKITEKVNMQFRCEAFNFINHFNPGAASPNSPDLLGAINQPTLNGATQFSQSPVVTPRQIQFALKFDF